MAQFTKYTLRVLLLLLILRFSVLRCDSGSKIVYEIIETVYQTVLTKRIKCNWGYVDVMKYVKVDTTKPAFLLFKIEENNKPSPQEVHMLDTSRTSL